MNSELKEVIAIIRPEKWRATQQAIFAAGAQGISQNRVLGRGRQAGLRYLKANREPFTMDYLPKRQLSCVAEAALIPEIVAKIIEVNKTGNAGDGKIFVCPVEDAVRIRTAERGEPAITK